MMSDSPTDKPENSLNENVEQNIPAAVVKKIRSNEFSLIWLIPIITLLIGIFFIGQAIVERGTNITISFKTAEGLTIGTKIKYRNVDVGEVKKIKLSHDRKNVIVDAQLTRQAKKMLLEDTKFWVVRPRISGGSITGLGTLLAGSHIGMDAGESSESADEFIGLEHPPIITSDLPGRIYRLQSDDIGSLDIGSPVYYRHIQAGQVVGYELSPNGKRVIVTVYINSPYDKFVNLQTRFWHANGIDVKLDGSGVKINTESLVSILLGGIAFENVENISRIDGSVVKDDALEPQAAENTYFNAFKNQDDAFKTPDTYVAHTVMIFNESVRGLSPGAQVDFQGINIGEVVSTSIDYDAVNKKINVVVSANLYPDRLRSKFHKSSNLKRTNSTELIGLLVSRGLRAQLRSSSLITGQLYIALDFFPKAPKVVFDANKTPLEIPTITGSLRELQTTLASIANKLDKVPFDKIGQDLHQTLNNANRLIVQIDEKIAPEATATLTELRSTLQEAKIAITEAQKTLKSIEQTVGADGQLQQDAHEAMREVTRAAQSTRALVDYLERHPEALIRGKAGDSKTEDKK